LFERNLNLSKTEFIAYLKCPFKFHIIKDLNSQIDQSMKIDYFDYEPNLADGIKRHLWFQNFYEKFGEDIQNNIYLLLSESDKNEEWKKKFIKYEINRYKQTPAYWEPVAVELFLKNPLYRGQIDRIDQLDAQGHCRIVEYKPYPKEFDEEELIFYSVLLTSELPHQNLPNITKVNEIGVYYYFTGEFVIAKVSHETIQAFEMYMENIRKEILNANLIKKKMDCEVSITDCLYRDICQRIQIKNQKIITFSVI